MNNQYQVTSETQTPLSTFPETPHISIIKDQTQQKVLRVEAELSAIKSHFRCELSTLNSKIESLTTSLNGALKKLENHPRKCCSIVQDNLLFLQKELLSKDEIIKSLLETQTPVFDSISNTALDKQTPTTLSVLPNLREKQQRKHQVQYLTKQQIKKQQEQPMQKTQYLKRTQKYNMKKVYLRNLNKDVTINDLNELFGFKTTCYLQDSCNTELPTNEKTGKLKGIAFISCPDFECNELIKLNETDFLETYIIVEEARSTRSRFNQRATNSVTRRPQVVVNQFPEKQDIYFKSNVVPGNR